MKGDNELTKFRKLYLVNCDKNFKDTFVAFKLFIQCVYDEITNLKNIIGEYNDNQINPNGGYYLNKYLKYKKIYYVKKVRRKSIEY